ncbi:putative disease resistance RPP13-like protein 1 isoform X2 [Vigna angularis]|uniref:putative disease resistance RPP13-like protein 1 isoform X2 n=1 Tax=Phaseolus angularis TaxID=3914 RepID=UPI0022B3685F|nr:putative disease resistance RPP13-like protein 1 isoform X2 [Vigna angularis]
MAAEIVGGALLSAFLQVAFDKLASPKFVDFFRGRKLDEKLLGNLNIMLHSINSLAQDAEQKQFTDSNVKACLFSVKETVFDAEDLLGEIDYELTRCQVEAESEPQTFTHKCFLGTSNIVVVSLQGSLEKANQW